MTGCIADGSNIEILESTLVIVFFSKISIRLDYE